MALHLRHTPGMDRTRRPLAGLPDALTAGFFLWLWVEPQRFGADALRSADLMIIVEFVLVHAAALMGVVALSGRLSRAARIGVLGAMAVGYLGFLAVAVVAFGQWWPLFAFGWLAVAKLAWVLDPAARAAARRPGLEAVWMTSIAAFVIGWIGAAALPVPELGLAAAGEYRLPGTGSMAEQPQRVLAFGVFYFAVLAWTKVAQRRPGQAPAASAPATTRGGEG
jgi:hypothetical protein